MSDEMSSAQEFFKKLEPLEEKFKQEQEFKLTFGTTGSKMVRSAFILMKSQLGLLADDADSEKVLVPEEYRKKIQDACKLVYIIAMERQVTPFYREFVGGYLQLMDHWNKEIGKSQKMRNYIVGTTRILNCSNTMNETITIMRHLLKRMKSQMNYRPPAFENARHYLLSLEEDLEALGTKPKRKPKTKKKATKKSTKKTAKKKVSEKPGKGD